MGERSTVLITFKYARAMCLINYLSAFSSFVSSYFHFSHRHDCLNLYHQTNWSTAGKSTREAPHMLFPRKEKKSIDSLPQSFLKYNTWRFSSAVLPSVGGLRRDPQAVYRSSYRLVLRIGLLRELMGPNYKTWVSLRSTRARIQGVDLDIHPPQNATKTKAPPYVGPTERGKKKIMIFFFFLPSSSLGSDKKHAVTRFPLADKRRVLISGSLVISWETRVVWEIDVGIGVGFGKRVETEPFVATCLGVGRTQETLSASFYLFFSQDKFLMSTATARACFWLGYTQHCLQLFKTNYYFLNVININYFINFQSTIFSRNLLRIIVY